jgi:hypothetical protein
MSRKLRIAVSVFFGVLTVAVAGAWVLNNWKHCFVALPWPFSNSEVSAWAVDGHTCFGFTKLPYRTPAGFQYYSGDASELFEKSGFAFSYDDYSGPDYLGTEIAIPDWFLLIVFGGTSLSPWLSWRFSLNTLLVITTLIAVILALSVLITS